MPSVIINGRRVNLPDTTTDAEIRRSGGVTPGRSLHRQEESGTYLIPPGSVVDVKEGDVFNDAPSRTKG